MLQQPGGTSSVQLGWEDSPKKTDKPKEEVDLTAAKGSGDEGCKGDANVSGNKSAVSSNAFATGSAQESPRLCCCVLLVVS